MNSELSRAISFANGYFVLADGLVPDLMDHLAEDVVLDWFGQTIKGRIHVATFMKEHKISSRHIFNEINPVTSIGYRKQTKPLRRKYYSIGGTHENGNLIGIRNDNNDDDYNNGNENNDDSCQIKYKRQCFSDGVIIEDDNSMNDESLNNTDGMEVEYNNDLKYKKLGEINDELKNKNISEISIADQMEYNLNFGRLKLDGDKISTPNIINIEQNNLNTNKVNCALNVLENEMKLNFDIKPTNYHEIEQKILQLKNYKVKMPLEFDKTKYEEGYCPSIYNDVNSIQYIEACGVIEFSRFFQTKQIRKDIRKRLCRLQIAYSIKNNNSNLTTSKLNYQTIPSNSMEMDENNMEVVPKKSSKLKSLKELKQLSDNLIPQITTDNDNLLLDDYAHDNDDDFRERNEFLKSLMLNSNDNDGENKNDLFTPKYVNHHLMYDESPKTLLAGTGDTRGFVFNYLIHLIIYERTTKCRLNLSHEFESKELSNK